MSQTYSRQESSAVAMPIQVNRVFDSCSDRDCFSNLQITLEETLTATLTLVKSRCVRVSDVCITIEPVPFNRGFYSIDLTYTFQVELMAYERSCGSPTLLTGTALASKNVILYGGESNTKTFYSSGDQIGETNACCEIVNLPTAAVQVVDPIALEARIVSTASTDGTTVRNVVMTLGLFSVVELFRPVTILVPTYEYTIPTKECRADTESPCAVFDKIRFPAEEFSPGTLPLVNSGAETCRQGCGNCQSCQNCGDLPVPAEDGNNG